MISTTQDRRLIEEELQVLMDLKPETRERAEMIIYDLINDRHPNIERYYARVRGLYEDAHKEKA